MNTLILSGYGTNCEKETAHACRLAGAAEGSVHVRHITEIYAGTLQLDEYGFLVLIGGFLDGDDLGSGSGGSPRGSRTVSWGPRRVERLETGSLSSISL